MEPTLTGIPLILSKITEIITEAADWISSFIECILDNPLILIFVIIAFVGLGVGLLSRLMHL